MSVSVDIFEDQLQKKKQGKNAGIKTQFSSSHNHQPPPPPSNIPLWINLLKEWKTLFNEYPTQSWKFRPKIPLTKKEGKKKYFHQLLGVLSKLIIPWDAKEATLINGLKIKFGFLKWTAHCWNGVSQLPPFIQKF